MTNTDNDIIASFHFRVLFTGLKGITDTDTRFESVSGIQGNRVADINNAGKAKDTGTAVFQPLILKRAARPPQASALLQWALQCLNTHTFPVLPEVLVQVLNEQHQPQLTVRLKQVTFKAWLLGELDARVSGILTEEFQLDYKAIEVQAG